MKALLLIAFRNVVLNWRHSAASILSITAAFFSLNIFQGYINDLTDLYYVSYKNRSMFGDLIVENKAVESAEAKSEPEKFELTPELQSAVKEFVTRHSDRIEAYARFLNLQGTISNGSVSAIFLARAYDTVEGYKFRGKLWYWNTLYGEPLNLHPENGRALLGQGLGKIMGCLPDPKVSALASDGGYAPVNRPFKCSSSSLQLTTTTVTGQVNAIDVDPVGLVDAGYSDVDRKFITLALPDAQTLLNTQNVSYGTLLLKNSADLAAVTEDFNREVASEYPMLHVVRWQDQPSVGDLYNRSMEFLTIFRNFVAIVIISISVMSILNTMTKSLSERTREVGTMLSFGFRQSHIRVVFLGEALLLCALGLAIGGVSSLLSQAVINKIGVLYKAGLLSEAVPFRIKLDPRLMLTTTLVLLALSALATVMALQRVLKKPIIECLHHV
jgi:putative ABC transport system permease protein